MSANPNGLYVPRAILHRQVVELKQAGLTFRAIAEQLQRSFSSVTDAYYDPAGEKSRERKRRHIHGRCQDCDEPVFNSGSRTVPDRCRRCDDAYRKTLAPRRKMAARETPWRYYSDEQILAAIRRAAFHGVAKGAGYDAMRLAARDRLPSRALIIRRYGSWANAVHAAGLRTTRAPSPDGYANRTPNSELVEAIQRCAGELGRWPTANEYREWSAGHAPGLGTIQWRFGSWMAAIEAAVADAELELAA